MIKPRGVLSARERDQIVVRLRRTVKSNGCGEAPASSNAGHEVETRVIRHAKITHIIHAFMNNVGYCSGKWVTTCRRKSASAC